MGGADAGRTVWRVADNLEKTLPCKFVFFVGKIFKPRYSRGMSKLFFIMMKSDANFFAFLFVYCFLFVNYYSKILLQ